MRKFYYPRMKSMQNICMLALSTSCLLSSISSFAQTAIYSVSPAAAVPGASVTISGTGFNTTAASNAVYFGATKATVTSASATSLAVTVPLGATNAQIVAYNQSTRLAGIQQYPFLPTYDASCFISGRLNFKPKVDFTTGTGSCGPYIAAIGDLDNDGKPDLVVANRDNQTVSILQNTASIGVINTSSFSTYSVSIVSLVPGRPSNVKLADLDGDGKLDIVLALDNSTFLAVYRNTSSGSTISFSSRALYLAGSGTPSLTEVAIADFDGDGKLDIAICSSGNDSVSILRNNISSPITGTSGFVTGAGASFLSRVSFSIGSGGYPLSIFAADLNNDGKMDIASSNAATGVVAILRNTSTSGSVSFGAHSDFSVGGTGSGNVEVAAGDINGDGLPDLLVACSGRNKLCVLQNTFSGGSLSFASRVDFSAGLAPAGLATGDLDGDGKVDVVVTNSSSSSVTIFRNASSSTTISSSTLATGVSVATGTGPIGVNIGDLDGDKMPDIVVANNASHGGNTISILKNYPLPYVDTIRGATSLCLGTASTFSDSITGGRWSLANTTVATINSATGVVTPLITGSDSVIYTVICNGDTNTVGRAFTVGSSPTSASITGPTAVCVGNTVTLSSSYIAGTGATVATWGITPSTSSFATLSASGVTATISGVATGSAIITYSVSNACGAVSASHTVRVSPAAGSITGGPFSVCVGASVTPGATTFGGSWTSSDYSIATINSTTGVVTGSAAGSATITYSAGGGCYATATVNVAVSPAGISGSTSVCLGSTTALSNVSSPGTWSSSDPTIASISSSSGVVSGGAPGTVTITYTLSSTSCTATFPFRVHPLPAAIGGFTTVCEGSNITLTDATSPGTWTSSNPAVGTIASATSSTGTFHGTTSGTTTVTYTLSTTGCIVTQAITVNPVPATITGPSSVCVGNYVTLSTASTGGTWSITPTSFGTIDPSTGVMRGLFPGTTIVRYSFPASTTGCYTTYTVTVNPNPVGITGSRPICPGYFDTLRNATTGGGWTSSDVTIATVGASTGIVLGVSGGTAVITYSLYATGCLTTTPVIIRPAPSPIIGTDSVCNGYTVLLTDTTAAGTSRPWSSTDTNIAKIDSTTGVVRGRSVGAVTISYTTSTYGCSAITRFVVNPILVPTLNISLSTPSTTVCAGDTVLYTAVITNGGLSPTYQWRVNGLITGTGPTFRYTPANGDTVRCVFHSSYPCAMPDSAVRKVGMTVNPRVTPRVTIGTLTGDTVCLGVSTLIIPTVTNGGPSPTFVWKVNGVRVWTGTSWTYVPVDSDVVTVVMTTNAACPAVDTAVDTMQLTVSRFLVPSVTIVGSDSVCEGHPAIYSAVPTNGGTSPAYTWVVNGISVGSGPVFSYAPTTGDTVAVVMTSNFPCVTTTRATSPLHRITVFPVPTPVVRMHYWPGYILMPGTYLTLSVTTENTGANPIYKWYRNGVLIPGETDAIYVTNVIAQHDSFVCRVTNTDICENITAFDYIIITIGDNVGVNNVNLENANINLMPNPNKGTFFLRGNLDLNIDEDVALEVTNALGQVVYKDMLKAKNGVIDEQMELNHLLSSGMYVLNVHSEHILRTIKFTLEK